MTSKEKLEALNYIWFYEPSCQEEADKREAIIKELKQDLERLEQIDNAKPSEALEILETFNGGLLNKEIGAISYNQIWLKNQIEALKQALLKAQQQDKILKILRNHLKIVDAGKVEFYDLINKTNVEKQSILIESMDTGASIHIHLNDDEKYNALKEWLDDDK